MPDFRRNHTSHSGPGVRCAWLGATSLALLATVLATVQAQAEVAFDRPGIGFGTAVLESGQFSWEQGLPDFSSDRRDHQSEQLYTASTLWRLGLGRRVELQLGAELFNRQSGHPAETGAGDASLALKYALPDLSPLWSWALLASYSHPTGQQPFRADHPSRSLAISLARELSNGRAVAGYLDYSSSGNDDSWTFSPSYTFYSDASFSAYTELGFSHGDEPGSSAGAGAVWRMSAQLQLDVWVLRGISQDATDWQGGFGIAWTPDD